MFACLRRFNLSSSLLFTSVIVDIMEHFDLEAVRRQLDAFAREHGFYGWWVCSAKDNMNISKPIQTLLNKVARYSGKVSIVEYVTP